MPTSPTRCGDGGIPEGPDRASEQRTQNQDFTVTPAEAQTKPASTTAAPNQGATTFTFTGLDNARVYDVALFPCDSVTTDDNGVVTFADEETNAQGAVVGNNVADDQDSTDTGAASITSVNNGSNANGVAPVNGSIQVTVNSDQVDCAVAVLWDDNGNDDDIDLDANNQPTDAFAVTGDIVWTANEAVEATYTGDAVTSTDKANNRFTADTNADDIADTFFNYDANDQFAIEGTTGRSLAQFEDALNAGDIVSVTYNPDAGGVSQFDITDNTTPAPTNVTASVTNADNGAVADDVVVNWTPGQDTASGTTYVVERLSATPNADGTCPTVNTTNYTTPVTVTDANNTDTTATDEDVPAGCYAYRVVATSPAGGSATASELSNSVRVQAAPVPDNTPPTLAGAQANDVNDGVGSTSQVRFTFDEPVTVLDATKFSVTTGTITFQGTSATVSGSTVVVTINGTLNDAATDNNYTADVAAAAVEDAAGNDNAADSAAFVY